MKKIFLIILSVGILSSCVGTIQDTAKKVSDANIIAPVNLSFGGITKGIAVAHNRVQLYFKPVAGGSGNYSYLVYQDGNLATPVSSISQSELLLDKNGEYSISVINGLSLGTSYTFLVRAFDAAYNVQDANNVQISLSTLSYKTPLFDGVQSVTNISGSEGETSLLVKWNVAVPATSSGGIFGGNTDAISGYNIYVGDSENTLAFYASVNDPDALSIKLTGLISDKIYFLRVRAKNSLSTPIEDLNEKFITKKTLTHLPISFAGVSSLAIPSSSAGFSKINVSWNAGLGNYDRYKIYATKNVVSSFNPASATDYVATVTDLSITSLSINVSDPHVIWYVAVVACNGATCVEAQGQNVIKYIRTSPPVANFNGIKTLTQAPGGEGLSALDLFWDLPDSASGVYDEIRIYKSNASGMFDAFADRIDDKSYDINNPSVPGYTLKGSTFLRVNGLATGVQSCFVALAYSTSPIDPSSPDGRTGVTKVVRCGTPQYNIPGFAGVSLTCTNITAKTFKVSWNAPTPAGTYEDYEIYYKQGSTGFVIADALAGAAGYTKKTVTSDSLSTLVTNLLMSSTYQILVKSHFYNVVDGNDYRDNNSVVTNCTTSTPLVEQGPWYELYATGPKLNGINGQWIPEKLTPPSGAIDGKSGATINKPEWQHQYPVESTGAELGVNESVNGIIRIAWEDMLLSDSLGHLNDFRTTPNTGYKVYRVIHNPLYGSTGPAINDSIWGTPINSDYILPPSFPSNLYTRYQTTPYYKSYAQYVDYSLPHPYNENINRANEATIYWYKIEPWYNGKKLAYSSIASDAIVRMMLPPKNMSFVHRWMSNKQICEDMGLAVERSNNYKCEYTGLGAIQDPDDLKYYYDMKGDLLVDRFEMGCNFSRGDTAYKCTNVDLPSGFDGAGADDPATGKKSGDCVGSNPAVTPFPYFYNSPNQHVSAKQGAIFYSRTSQTCYVNTSNTVGVSWSALSQIDGSNALNVRQYFEGGAVAGNTIVNEGATKIPPASGRFPVGLGYGSSIYSNNSKLPAIINSTDPIALNYTCMSSSISVNGNTLKTYLKKLSRRKEFIAYAAESPILNNVNLNKLQSGLAQQTNDTPLAPIVNYLTMPLVNHNDRDCNSSTDANYGYYNPATGIRYQEATYVTAYSPFYTFKVKSNGKNVAGTPAPGTVLDYADPRWANGGMIQYLHFPLLTTGSAGPLSSEACTSRFGIQDATGNASEWSTDLFYCNPDYGCSMGFKDRTKTTTYTPPIDPDNKENYKNANGEYFNIVDTNSSHPSIVSMGTKLLARTSNENTSRNYTTNFLCLDPGANAVTPMVGACPGGSTQFSTTNFFNVAMGLPLDCEGSTCGSYDSSSIYDSNILVTPRAASGTSTIKGFDAGFVRMGSIAGTGASQKSSIPSIVGIVNGGDTQTGSFGRFEMLFNSKDIDYNSASGRCDVLIESY